MDDIAPTNPTSAVTAQEFAAVTLPPRLRGLSMSELAAEISEVERRGQELARRLGVDRRDGRLPAYIWAIVFGQS